MGIELAPARLDFGEMTPGSHGEAEVELVNATRAAVTIVDAIPACGGCTVVGLRVPVVLGPAGRMAFTISWQVPREATGPARTSIAFSTNNEAQPRLELPVTAVIQPRYRIEVQPESVTCGTIPAWEERCYMVRVASVGARASTVESVRVTPDVVRCELSHLDDDGASVYRLVVPARSFRGRFEGHASFSARQCGASVRFTGSMTDELFSDRNVLILPPDVDRKNVDKLVALRHAPGTNLGGVSARWDGGSAVIKSIFPCSPTATSVAIALRGSPDGPKRGKLQILTSAGELRLDCFVRKVE